MFCFLVIICDEKEDDKESTYVFDDTFESLRRIAPPTGVYPGESSSCEFFAKNLRQTYINIIFKKDKKI